MPPKIRPFFWLFAASGFCSLVYELVWLRQAMAQFGVTTPLISMFLSLFMAGLGLGSWIAGRWSSRFADKTAAFDLRLYAACELCIAVGAFAAPAAFSLGRGMLIGSEPGASWDGSSYYAACGAWLAAAVLPWSACMGATIPLALSAISKLSGRQPRAFSYLYLANVLGAALGSAVAALLLIELLGFRNTLSSTAVVNVLLAGGALILSRRMTGHARPRRRTGPIAAADDLPLAMLFTVGCMGMGMELVWARQFSLYLGNDVYALGSILALYLMATAAGSAIYRAQSAGGMRLEDSWSLLGALALLPLAGGEAALLPFSGALFGELRLALGIAPVCLAMGFVTPALVDRFSEGNAELAGRACAVNVLGCIAGPLLAGLLLLPRLGERWSLVSLSLPFLLAGWRFGSRLRAAAATAAAAALLLVTHEPWSHWPEATVLRDHMATVVAGRSATGEKQLLVNGNTMTMLTPITKMMAHLPLAHLASPPKNAIVICFGMGTTFRSLTSWGMPATAVELVPSVPRFFDYFHPDAARAESAPGARIVIDDGRRYLERSKERYDVITLDPPPPAEAPGNSLLYSREFYAIARRRLSAGGILHQWHMGGDPAVTSAMARALRAAFPHVRAFPSTEGWGCHFLASMTPIPTRTPQELARRLPPAARADLVEWGPARTAEEQFRLVVANEMPIATLMNGQEADALSDDRPINEYFLLRRLGLIAPVSHRLETPSL